MTNPEEGAKFKAKPCPICGYIHSDDLLFEQYGEPGSEDGEDRDA